MAENAKNGSLVASFKKDVAFSSIYNNYIWALGSYGHHKVPYYLHPSCFSGSTTVQTSTKGVIPVSKLRLNDSVLTFTPGIGNRYTKVS